VSVGSLSAGRLAGVIDSGRARARGDPAATVITVALVSLTVLAAILRFTRLAHQGFWFDEANTAADLRYAPGKMLGLLPQNETTPPLFYCVAWVWARILGFGEFALRSLPALSGVATVPVMYLATARLVSRRAGIVAAALTACNPFLVWYSQEFRPYMPMVLLAAASLLAFAQARERPTRGTLIAWAVICSLALADHYYALLVVVPEAVWLLADHRRRHGTPVAHLGGVEPVALPAPSVELDAELEDALRSLSAQDREALLLVAWEDLTPTAAAASLGISAAAFRVRLHRARRRLVYELENGPRRHALENCQPSLEQL